MKEGLRLNLERPLCFGLQGYAINARRLHKLKHYGNRIETDSGGGYNAVVSSKE